MFHTNKLHFDGFYDFLEVLNFEILAFWEMLIEGWKISISSTIAFHSINCQILGKINNSLAIKVLIKCAYNYSEKIQLSRTIGMHDSKINANSRKNTVHWCEQDATYSGKLAIKTEVM